MTEQTYVIVQSYGASRLQVPFLKSLVIPANYSHNFRLF
jgi:hypothetical protein